MLRLTIIDIEMDDIVKQAMAKWPDVPDCYGWLGLDMRGHWYLRDAATQVCGDFPNAKGQRLEHAGLLAFLGRNYQPDAQGRWYFQNGPQRVFVELQVAPWVLRVDSRGGVETHTGLAVAPQQCLQDEQGWVYLAGAYGLGLVHGMDMVHVAEQLEQGRWIVADAHSTELAERFGFVRSPKLANGE